MTAAAYCGLATMKLSGNPFLENIHIVDRHSTVEVCALTADVPRLNGEVPRQFALDFDVEILNVGVDTMIVESQQRIRPHIERFLGQRLYVRGCWQRHGKVW